MLIQYIFNMQFLTLILNQILISYGNTIINCFPYKYVLFFKKKEYISGLFIRGDRFYHQPSLGLII